MKHFGDITKINGHEVPIVDIITGGSPCQDLSIAGKRAGLEGERSGLFYEQIRIIKEMHDECRRTNQHLRPRFQIFENVYGAFSSNGGEDFRIMLEEIARIADSDAAIPRLADGQTWSNAGCILGDRWSIAWRLQNGQFLGKTIISNDGKVVKRGTPQRRRRIALVADFRGQAAPEILFEREGVSTDFETGLEAREGLAQDSRVCAEESGGAISYLERAGCEGGGKGILIQNEKTASVLADSIQMVCYGVDRSAYNQGENAKFDSPIYDECSPVLTSRGPSAVMAFRKQGHPMNQDMGQGWEETEVSDTLNCFDNSESHSPTIILEGNGSRPSHHGDGFLESDVSYTLNTAEQHCVAYEQKNYSFGNGQIKTAMQLDEELAKTLNCMHDPQAIITSNFIVRRITPLEAERLQGFPDNWTNIGEWVDTNGKKHKPADTPRYKALGNSLCLPFWEWLAERVVEQLKDETDAPTMASLFDGIGGFPLVFQRKGCQPVWASEIEEFPIAVTKFHFPEVEERNE